MRTQPRQKICLSMIVKNEAAVIKRCLASVLPLINYWIIVDTGSEDGTQDVIKDYMQSVPGELHERPWVDFAHNRSEALDLARSHGDYTLIIDADDILELPPGFRMPFLKEDSIVLEVRNQGRRLLRPQLVRNTVPWRYEGVLHEFLSCADQNGRRMFAENRSQKRLPGVKIVMTEEGARRRTSSAERYRRDALVFENALQTETDPFLVARYKFYLAQSYLDAGEKQKALVSYQERAKLGFWDQEIFISLYRSANIKAELGYDADDVIESYLQADRVVAGRAEALHGAARFCRQHDRFREGYEFARRALNIKAPVDGLFVDDWVYDYGILDEYAVNAYWAERYADCLAACERLLKNPKIPAESRQRIEQNARFAREKLSPRQVDAKTELAEAFPAPEQRELTPTPIGAPEWFNSPYPRVLLAILAKQKERTLPFYLRCIEALDYPKASIVLYVRTNNNTDRTADILKDWIARVGDQYAHTEFETSDVPESVERFDVHEWNATRFKVLARLRQESMERALQSNCDYYFVVDVDNFIKPNTLKELISMRLPIVAPLLRHVDESNPYSNFHEKIDRNGYFVNSDEYFWLLNQRVKGLCKVPVVHCTYLVRSDVIPLLSYDDNSSRHEYVVFSDSARKNGVPQYFDTREVYGYLTLAEEAEKAMKLIGPQIGARILAEQKSERPRIFACFGQHSSGSTWMFNLVREICRTQGVDFLSLHRDSETNLPWDVLGSKLIVVRSPNPFPSFQAFMANCGEPTVITVREPRDAVVSFMQRFANSLATNFDEALKAIALSAQCLVSLSRRREIPVFRYEDGFVGNCETFDRIATLLGTSPSDDQRRTILAKLSPESVRKTISELEAAGAIRGEEVWDKENHWHANHVGDGKIGKFRSLLTKTQQHEIIQRTRGYCDCFGYDTKVDI